MAIFLGIDGGATKTSCVIGDECSILGTGRADGSNVIRVGEELAKQALTVAIGDACTAARIDPTEITQTCIGVAGAARPQIHTVVQRILQQLVGGEIEVAGDMVIALDAAFDGEPGVVVIAGTGSIAYGENATGETARAGGWGWAISDEGSGYWIGRTAVAGLMRSRDEEPAQQRSLLLEGVLQCWGLHSVDELVPAANASPPRDFSRLFPVAVAASDAGDAVAREVLQRAGVELAQLASIVMGGLFSEAANVQVGMSGGVFANSALVRQAFQGNLSSTCPVARVKTEIADPVFGALARARRIRGKHG